MCQLSTDFQPIPGNLSFAVLKSYCLSLSVLLQAAYAATQSPAAICRPTWWLCPTDEACLTADQRELNAAKDILHLISFWPFPQRKTIDAYMYAID